MYQMVRNVADHLVENYRNYKCALSSYDSACEEASDMQKLITSDDSSGASEKLPDRGFQLRQSKRKIKDCEDSVELHRHQLLDLAGADAVVALDQQIIEGQKVLARVGVQSGRPLLIPQVKSAELEPR